MRASVVKGYFSTPAKYEWFYPKMDSQQLIGKRKKKIPKNPNPLFTKWIEEELKNAQEKGFKSQLSLKKVKLSIIALFVTLALQFRNLCQHRLLIAVGGKESLTHAHLNCRHLRR